MKIYVIYASADRAIVSELIRRLQDEDIDATHDIHLATTDEEFRQRLDKWMDTAEAVVVLLSDAFLNSSNSRHELRRAAAIGKPLFPVLLQPMGRKATPPELKRLPQIALYDPGAEFEWDPVGLGIDRGMTELARAIRARKSWAAEVQLLEQDRNAWVESGRRRDRLRAPIEAKQFIEAIPSGEELPLSIWEYLNASQAREISEEKHDDKSVAEPSAQAQKPDIRQIVRRWAERLAINGTSIDQYLGPTILALLSANLLLHVTLQRPSLPIVLFLSLAIIGATAWSHWRDAKRERVPLGTVWARSRLAWAALALLIPLSMGYALHRQAHDGPVRLLAHLDAPVSAVAAGVVGGEARIVFATYDGKLHFANPDSAEGQASLALPDGDARPVTELIWRENVFADLQITDAMQRLVEAGHTDTLVYASHLRAFIDAFPDTWMDAWSGWWNRAGTRGGTVWADDDDKPAMFDSPEEYLETLKDSMEGINPSTDPRRVAMPGVIAVRQGEVLWWNGEGEPVTIWSGDGVPLVALDEGQRLVIVETRGLRRGDTRYAALSRVWDQSAENRGLSFDMAMSLTGRNANFTFAISLADPLTGATEAVHFQQAPILPTALAVGRQGAEARLMIGGSEGELLVCAQGRDGGALAVQAGAPYFECPGAIPSGSSSPISAFILEGDRATTQHRDGAVVVWALADNTWTPGEPGQGAPAISSTPGRMRLPGSDVELTAFRDHAPEMATLSDGRIIAGGWDGRVMIVDPDAAGAMAQADSAAWIASLWAPVGDTARTMFANIPGLGSSNTWDRLSSADRAIAIDGNPRASTDVWFAVGSVIAKPRDDFTALAVEPATTTVDGQPLPTAAANRRRLDVDGAVAARDRLGSTIESLGLSGVVTPSESGTMTTTIGVDPSRWQPLPPNIRNAGVTQAQWEAMTREARVLAERGPATQTQQAAAPPPIPIRTRFLGSDNISSLFAAEAEAECVAAYTPAQIRANPAVATACMVQALRQSGDYEYVDVDYIARPAQAAAGFGVGAMMRDQWALGAGVGGANLSAFGWSTPVADGVASAEGVAVAIIDTGIASNHPSVAGAAWLAPGYDMVSDPLMGNDGDGRDNDPNDNGDRCNTEDLREADSLHGTRVAGLVAAAGVTGTKIVPVRALGRCGGKLSDINDAILWAAGVIPARNVQGAEVWNANPADIINLSFEFPVACPASLQNAIDQAVATGAVVVAAAGNGGRDAGLWSPGGCRNVVSVGAADARGAPTAYSNFGAGVTLYAPGGDLSRDDNGDGVKDGVVSWGEGGTRCVDAITGDARSTCSHVMSAGTSNAAALATAALAMLKAEYTAATPQQLMAELTRSTRESCVPHPNPRHRRLCIGGTGEPVRVLGAKVEVASLPLPEPLSVEGPLVPVTGPRLALVITQANYNGRTIRRVEKAGDEGGHITRALDELDFDITPVANETKAGLETALEQFRIKLKAAGPDAVAFIYYTGHGIQHPQHPDNFLLGTDTDLKTAADIETFGVSLTAQRDLFHAVGARGVVMVFDACRNIPPNFKDTFSPPGFESATKGMVRMKAPVGMLVAYSTDEGDVAEEGAYAPILADELLKPGRTIEQAFESTKYRVADKSGRMQRPWSDSKIYESLCLNCTP